MRIDPAFSRWLQEGVIFAPAVDDGVAGDWGELARSSDIVSPLALEADAEDEGARQLAFLAGPLVIDEHIVNGLRFDLFGKPVTIVADRLGYEAGVPAFVIGVEEADDTETSTLTVVRRLA